MTYKRIDKLGGWLSFAVAAVTYILTTEATASFWDCGEFIATADKLLVGHPPGAPLFMIMARFFAILAPDVTYVAKMVNIMSALASAFTILFLYWTITHLARKMLFEGSEWRAATSADWRVWAAQAAGMVGALAYTFSDTFWFSAVEGEVYGCSSFFTAIVFWAILRWEDVADEPGADRWLVLIAYLMGLSIGVHLLNLLCIPPIALVYYFRRHPQPTWKGITLAFLISCAILGFILYGIIPGLVKIAGYFELFFVNSLGCPLNTGAIVWLFAALGALVWGIYITYQRRMAMLNTALACLAVIIVGYCSFAMVVIRSASDPTMDQNSPDNVFSLIDYLNREQYGDRPLFYGQTFASPLDRSVNEQGDPVYIVRDGKYVEVGRKPIYKYQASMLLPRMYSSQQNHIDQYKSWSGFKGRDVPVVNDDGTPGSVKIPTQGENLQFLFSYQINFMYLRYFMWNFAGRQNDVQSHGELTHGNWLTGLDWLDTWMLGDQSLLPDYLRNNKGHNTYFMLPLLLGLLGLFFHSAGGSAGSAAVKRDFWIVLLLFFMTGLAIVLYLNQTPLQPRERDYAYAGSFYAFCIFIGLGVLQLVEWLQRVVKQPVVATAIVAAVALLAVPARMAAENWDDHDRSDCTIARDIAYNYLNSCDPDAVLYTNGDNDTFPLWYAQEVEGVRTDVRVCNLSYLQTEWYCDQMLRQAYESKPLPISFTHEQYTHDRDVVYIVERNKGELELNKVMAFVRSDDPKTKRLPQYTDGPINYIPGRSFVVPVDSASAVASGTVSPDNASKITDMHFKVGGSYILKNQLMVLDMLNNVSRSGWRRPLYYSVTVGRENYCGLDNWFQLEGLAYRIAPVEGKPDPTDPGDQGGTVDTEKMWHKVMEQFRWGFYNGEGLYLDENKTRMGSNLRNNLTRLATALLSEAAAATDSATASDKRHKAVQVLDKIQAELPSRNIPHNFFSLELARDYYTAGVPASGDSILREFATDNYRELTYCLSLDDQKLARMYDSVRRCMAIYYEIDRALLAAGRQELSDELNAQYREAETYATQLFGR